MKYNNNTHTHTKREARTRTRVLITTTSEYRGITAATLQVISEAVEDEAFLGKMATLSLVSHKMGSWMRWCEGCWCHNDLLIGCPSWPARKAALLNACVPDDECHWSCCRGTELALGKYKEMILDLENIAGHPTLIEAFHNLPRSRVDMLTDSVEQTCGSLVA